jgi:hypothetical protein
VLGDCNEASKDSAGERSAGAYCPWQDPFEDNYRFHSADDPYVPDTTIPRLRPIPLGPRNVGYLEHEVDDLIDALAKLRDIAPAAHEPLAQRCARARAARRDSVHSKRDKAARP